MLYYLNIRLKKSNIVIIKKIRHFLYLRDLSTSSWWRLVSRPGSCGCGCSFHRDGCVACVAASDAGPGPRTWAGIPLLSSYFAWRGVDRGFTGPFLLMSAMKTWLVRCVGSLARLGTASSSPTFKIALIKGISVERCAVLCWGSKAGRREAACPG